MPYSSRSYVNRYIPSNRFPVGLKWLLVVNVGTFLINFFLRGPLFLRHLMLVPSEVARGYEVWQLVTYMFINVGMLNTLWNMLALWMFGAELERLWGTTRFLRFYLSCGVLAGLTFLVCAFLFHATGEVAAGSSGAVYGILIAYGLMFPDQTMLFGFLIPMKSKYFVMIIGAIVFLQSYMATVGGQGGVAVVSSLGGLAAGYLLLRGRRLQSQVRKPVLAGYKDWKLRRAKKKFQVYLKKQDSNRDRWVH
ncbi:MAG: Rhomboid family protein [Bryobacterales bacterium]|jgi:rhomboid family protein|nr:Rhomboid family protein [Bryobacterales bacterium]